MSLLRGEFSGVRGGVVKGLGLFSRVPHGGAGVLGCWH